MEEEIVACMYCTRDIDLLREPFEVILKGDDLLHYYHPFCYVQMKHECGTLGEQLWH